MKRECNAVPLNEYSYELLYDMMGLNNASHDHRLQDAQLAAADHVHHADLNFEVSHRGL